MHLIDRPENDNRSFHQINYDYSQAQHSCVKHGLHFDERMIGVASPVFAEANMSQEQVDDMLYLHVEMVAWMMNRRNYSWYQRIMLSLYWLGFGKCIGRGKFPSKSAS